MYGTKIAVIRLARGYSQEYVAQKLGIKQNSYSKIEKDERVVLQDDMLDKIAEVLGVSVQDIKSPTPVIMNFQHSPYNIGTQNNNMNENLLNQLIEQLKIKDQQINELISKLKC